ncbi:MAG: hypothetical protein ACNS60_03715 [Candidatus Cyclobacteriaceae bacterium M2_1C_046]
MGDLVYRISEIADFSELFPILILIVFRRIKLYPVLFTGLLIHSILEIYTLYLSSQKIYNLDIYQLIGLIELCYVFLFYKNFIKISKPLTIGFIAVFLFYILNSLFIEPFYVHINPYGRSISALYLMILGIYFLHNIYKEENFDRTENSQLFWINIGFIFYFSTSFFTFLFSRKLLTVGVEPTSFFGSLWTIHTLADIIRSIIIAFALTLNRSSKYE